MMKNLTDHLFVVIEGVDGSGKTTISQELCQRIGAQYYKTPPSLLEEFSLQIDAKEITLRRYVDETARTKPQLRFLFYLFGLAQASHEIRDLLINGHVVCDRYLSSTLAYHWALDDSLRAVDLNWLTIIKPDCEFLLSINDNIEHRKRLLQRGGSKTDADLEKDFEFLIQVQNNFRQLNLCEIDTSHLAVSEVVSTLERMLENAYRSNNVVRAHEHNHTVTTRDS